MSEYAEDQKDMSETTDSIIAHSDNPDAQRIAVSAALRLFYSKGYRSGYDDGMKDSKSGKDRRVVAHLN